MKPAKFFAIIMIVILIVIVSPSLLVSAQEGEDPPDSDMYARLEAINPDAVPIFENAIIAYEEGNSQTAQKLLLQVLELAPGFPDALRLLSFVELELGNVNAAYKYAGQAYDKEPDPLNRAILVYTALQKDSTGLAEEAFQHALIAADEMPDNFFVQWVLFYASFENGERYFLRDAAEKMTQLEPNIAESHYAQGIVYAIDEEWTAAENELLMAQELGMPAESVQEILDQWVHPEVLKVRVYQRIGYSVGGWLAGMAVLFVVGTWLSNLTMRTVENYQSTGQFEVSSGEKFVRNLYRVVIAITSVYYYVSIPFVILVVVGVVAGIFYIFMFVGRIPLRLALFVVLAGLYTLYAVVRSVLVRAKDADPGRLLKSEEAPRLWSLSQEVADKVGERLVDAIYIIPDAAIAVTERGGVVKKMSGKGQRCLILGLGALEGMTQSQFRAILAHEYGHFSNKDTAGGNFANRVRYSIQQMAVGLAQKGMARWYNPAWWFFNGFYRLFLRVTLGASRLQEILADRYAALAYGTQNFVDGLKHIIRRSLEFESQTAIEITSAVRQRRALENLYALPPLGEDVYIENVEHQFDVVINRTTSKYDSHPSPQKRFDLVKNLSVGGYFEDNRDPVWDLLPKAQVLQEEMTRLVHNRVSGLSGLR